MLNESHTNADVLSLQGHTPQPDRRTKCRTPSFGLARRRPLLRGTIIALGRWRPMVGFPGLEVRNGIIACWCPHCGAFHKHGWQMIDDATYLAHRGAHCHVPNSPFLATGYFISPWRLSLIHI